MLVKLNAVRLEGSPTVSMPTRSRAFAAVFLVIIAPAAADTAHELIRASSFQTDSAPKRYRAPVRAPHSDVLSADNTGWDLSVASRGPLARTPTPRLIAHDLRDRPSTL